MSPSIPSRRGQVKSPLVVPDVSGMDCRSAAHAYLDAGLMPHPWRAAVKNGSRTKVSCYSKFSFHEIRETHEAIDKWRHNWQVGLVLSQSSGLIAGDIDDEAAFEAWDFQEWPLTVQARTGRDGGRHLLYDARALDASSWPVQGNMPGGQVKSNGFIGVEPSVHPNGRAYKWVSRKRSVTPIGSLGVALAAFRSRPVTVGGDSPGRRDAGELWMGILGAEDGTQRGAIFSWASFAHDRGLSDEEIVDILELAVMKGEIASFRQRDPWNRKGLRSAAIPTGGWRHTPGGASVSVIDGVSLSVAPSPEEKKFWGSHDVLKHIQAWARARRASPWAVLGECLAEAVCHCPSTLQLPPLVGGNGSLNMLIALTGKSGAGKDAAGAVAEAAFSWHGVLGSVGDVVSRIPLGSGEGLSKNFGFTRRDETGPVLVRTEESVIVTITEIDTLLAVNGRSGSTLSPQLRQLYNGQMLGFGYGDPSKRVIIPQHSYRSCVIAGVQPGRGQVILGDIEGGFAQRWLWLPATDPYAPADVGEAPPPMGWFPPDIDYDNVSVMNVCHSAREEAAEMRWETLKGVASDMDSHSNYTRLKVAAALALLFGEVEVSEDVWSLSRYVMKVSGECRDAVASVLSAGAIARSAEEGRLQGVARAAARESEVSSRVERNVMAKLGELSRGEWIAFNKLRMKIASRDREDVPSVLSLLVSRGAVEMRDHSYQGQNGVQYRLFRGVR